MTRQVSKHVLAHTNDNETYRGKQYPISDEIEFWHNTITLVIGERNSGKTFSTLQQVLGVFVNHPNGNKYDKDPNKRPNYNYQCCVYISGDDDEKSLNGQGSGDATVDKFIFPDGTFGVVHTSNPIDIAGIISRTAEANNQEGRESIIIFDDSMYLLQGQSRTAQALQRKMFRNRQPQITYFILLQDEVGISPAMKHNANFIKLYGGLGPEAWKRLWQRVNMPKGLTYEEYNLISSKDYLYINLINKSYEFIFRRCEKCGINWRDCPCGKPKPRQTESEESKS